MGEATGERTFPDKTQYNSFTARKKAAEAALEKQ
jgi:hypothetical protein